MASADCVCCGQPATVPGPVPVEPEECDCGCFDCDECAECYHDDGPVFVQPVVLCDDCREEDVDEGVECGPGAWHCRCGRSCDGSACPGASPGEHYQAYADYVRGTDDGGAA